MTLFLFLLALFPSIEKTIPEGPFIYPGLHPREVIFVDPENSPILDTVYKDLKKRLSSEYTEKEILQIISLYIREEIFDLNKCNPASLTLLIQELHPEEDEPEISLDAFLQEKTGLCRHVALVTTYLVDRLVKDEWLEGETFFIRENLPDQRHAWTLFISEEGAWHLDALWGVLENGKSDAGFFRLSKKYGRRTMEGQKKHWRK